MDNNIDEWYLGGGIGQQAALDEAMQAIHNRTTALRANMAEEPSTALATKEEPKEPEEVKTFSFESFGIKKKGSVGLGLAQVMESTKGVLVKDMRNNLKKVTINFDKDSHTFWGGFRQGDGYYDFDIHIFNHGFTNFRTYPGTCGVMTLSNVTPLFRLNQQYVESLLTTIATKYAILEFHHYISDIIPYKLKGLSINTLGINPKSGNLLYRYEIDLSKYRAEKDKIEEDDDCIDF